jgi:hypothetical protein
MEAGFPLGNAARQGVGATFRFDRNGKGLDASIKMQAISRSLVKVDDKEEGAPAPELSECFGAPETGSRR